MFKGFDEYSKARLEKQVPGALKSFKHNLFVNSGTIQHSQDLRNIKNLKNPNYPFAGKKRLQI